MWGSWLHGPNILPNEWNHHSPLGKRGTPEDANVTYGDLHVELRLWPTMSAQFDVNGVDWSLFWF